MALKVLLFVLIILLIISCSTKKNSNISNIQSNKIISTDHYNHRDNRNLFIEELTGTQIQKLQENNIVYFDLNKYNIHPDFSVMLDAHVNFLRNNPLYKINIEGHTDERGTPEYNIALGERRADAVKMYLQGKGVSIEQISIVSYGKEKPVVLGHSEEFYAKNRRAIIVY